MRNSGIHYLMLFLTGTCLIGGAQTYPSALVTQFTGQRTLFLDEYADPFQPRIRTTIFFTDFTESSWPFALKMKITGPSGIVISTRPGARPNVPLTVAPGQPLAIEGADLAFYFDYDNLEFSGISRKQLELDHRLPEGLYTFCFEAVDYESGRSLSHPACAAAYLSLLDPPLILSPQHGQVVENVSMQNILLQWQPGNVTGNFSSIPMSYEIRLYEVTSSWANPVTAIMNNQALLIWQSLPMQQTSYLYSLTEPPLEKGKRYVFTVRAVDGGGRSRFKNNGYSMPRYFRFGYLEGDTIQLEAPGHDFQFTLGSPSIFSWHKPPQASSSQMVTYSLRVVEVDSTQTPDAAMLSNTPFFQQTFLASNGLFIQKTIPVVIWANIKRMARYAWQVTATSGVQPIAVSEVRTFTGPPDIESFIAGGFVMTLVRLDYYDRSSGTVSGRCRTMLNAGQEPSEFGFSMIGLAPIGNNEWVMDEGVIADRIPPLTYTLTPDSVSGTAASEFEADSIRVTSDVLEVTGVLKYEVPHLNVSGEKQLLISRRGSLALANLTYKLTGNAPLMLSANYDVPLLDPFGFRLRIASSSAFGIYNSVYSAAFSGFADLPPNVRTVIGTTPRIAFSGAPHLVYISEQDNEYSEAIALARNTGLDISPLTYVIDLDETRSPGDRSANSFWKGLWIEKMRLSFPAKTEISGQISLPAPTAFTIVNSGSDTIQAHVDNTGLHFRSQLIFDHEDSLRFNTFVSTQAAFDAIVSESEIISAGITGSIQVPLLDTAAFFPYRIELREQGFSEGYLVNAMAGRTFTFNPSGSVEQRLRLVVARALFRNRNRIEFDVDLYWPHFNLQVQNVQRLCAWGNNNIGFDIPNGRYALLQQGQGKAGAYDITVDQIGCGRSGNVYGFGISAKICMDEEISGETGPPVINAYSICRNPLLTGTLVVPDSEMQSLVGGTVSSGSLATPQMTGTAAGYQPAIASGFNDALQQLGFNPADTIKTGVFADEGVALLSGNVITEAGNVIKMIVRLKPYIGNRVSDKDWEVLDRVGKFLETDVVRQAQVTNAKGVLNFALNKTLEGLVSHVNNRISSVGQLAVGKVRAAINNKIAGPINSKIDGAISSVIDRLQKQALLQAEEKYHQTIITSFGTVKTNLSDGIRTSVLNSFEENITSKIDGVVQGCVISRITDFVRREVTAAGQQLIANGMNADIGLRQILVNGGTMFEDVADTVRDVIMQLNGHNFVSTAESLVEDAITGVDWDAIASQIMNDLVSRSVPQLIASQLTGAIADNAGVYAAAVLSTVKFDFSNLGEKLQNGQLDQVVKFDPTNIYIESPAVDVRGTLVFTKDDPVYGDSWQANVLVRVKVPKKDNPIECTAYFINGKTTQGPSFTYWLVKLGVSGLAIPLSPAPLLWDGAAGSAYSKMKKTGEAMIPDATNKFGVSCNFTFIDQQSSGATIILSLGAEAEFNDGGFAIQLNGNASMLNFRKTGQKYASPGFVTGTGSIGYYKTADYSKIAGNFNVQLNTQPVLCAGGSAGFDLRGPSDWKVWVGTRPDPFAVKLLCKDFLMNSAYVEVGNSGFAAGIKANVNVNAQSPWLEFTGIKVRGYASFAFGYSVTTAISWEPAFQITEATVSAWISAALGVEYQTAAGQGSLTLAGVSLAGTLSYHSQPESELHGELSGSITVVGFTVGFETPVHYSLSKQQILN